MRNWLTGAALTAVTALTVAGLSAPSRGCIAIPIDRPNQPPVSMRLAEQRAFIFREKDKQHLVLSIQYDGAVGEFAWIIPVESKPEVDVLAGAPFTELRKMTRIQEPVAPTGALRAPATAATEASVQVLERKEAGPYDLAVLRASNTGGLYEWLKKNGFKLDKNSRGALDSYVTRNFVFVAARIRPGSQQNQTVAERLRSGTIAPLHMAYKTPQLSYPLRVTSGNPGVSHMELYVLNPTRSDFGALEPVKFRLTPQGSKGFRISGPANLANPEGEFPTIRKLIPKGGTLVKLEGDLSDEQRQKDLVFDAPGDKKDPFNPNRG